MIVFSCYQDNNLRELDMVRNALNITSLFNRGRISKKGAFFLALKGLHIPAQGNALGNTLQ